MRTRTKLLVNWSVQGIILRRLAVHLVTFMAAISTLLMVFWMYQRNAAQAAFWPGAEPLDAFWYRAVPFASASLALLPLIVWDMLRISHRIAGPLYRFEQVMEKFEATGQLEEANLRDNDLLRDFCSRFNSFVTVMHDRYPETQNGAVPVSHEAPQGPVTLKCYSGEPEDAPAR